MCKQLNMDSKLAFRMLSNWHNRNILRCFVCLDSSHRTWGKLSGDRASHTHLSKNMKAISAHKVSLQDSDRQP